MSPSFIFTKVLTYAIISLGSDLMKKMLKYFAIFLIVLLIIILYCLKMTDMGMSMRNIITFIIMFFAAVLIAGSAIMICTRGIRKKLGKH